HQPSCGARLPDPCGCCRPVSREQPPGHPTVRGGGVKTVATYSFLPWLRQGVANTIASADGDPAVKLRASIDVSLTLSGDPLGSGAELTQSISQKVALYGPGDIVGIDPRAVVRTEPRNWITNFEANYLPAIDFYDEDFPWRYTPAVAGGSGLRLRPWLTLIVL